MQHTHIWHSLWCFGISPKFYEGISRGPRIAINYRHIIYNSPFLANANTFPVYFHCSSQSEFPFHLSVSSSKPLTTAHSKDMLIIPYGNNHFVHFAFMAKILLMLRFWQRTEPMCMVIFVWSRKMYPIAFNGVVLQ